MLKGAFPYFARQRALAFFILSARGDSDRVIILRGPDGGAHLKTREEVSIVSHVTAPMGGKIIDVKVKPGDSVAEGDEVVILEAMKMELPVVAEASGTVKEVKCKKGDAVEAEAVLVVIE
jgi:biotin carboxyl carrier protein